MFVWQASRYWRVSEDGFPGVETRVRVSSSGGGPVHGDDAKQRGSALVSVALAALAAVISLMQVREIRPHAAPVQELEPRLVPGESVVNMPPGLR